MRRTTVVALLSLCLMAAVAQGTVLHTGYIERDSDAPGFSLVCGATNVGQKPSFALIQVIDFAGNVVVSQGFTLEPGATSTAEIDDSTAQEGAGCRFDVQGGKSHWRANGCIFDETKNICISTIEAR